MDIKVLQGDISLVEADALITAINSGGMWFGGIDGVIQRAAGGQFHEQAGAAMPLTDGQTVVARKKAAHRGKFGDVVFVVDDLQRPLSNVVFSALSAATQAGHRTVSLPTIRLGVMLGAVEKTRKEAVDQMVGGIRVFRDEYPDGLDSITFVVFRDPEVANLIESAVAGLE